MVQRLETAFPVVGVDDYRLQIFAQDGVGYMIRILPSFE